MHDPPHLLNLKSARLVDKCIRLTLLTLSSLQTAGEFHHTQSLMTPLACADFSGLLVYHCSIRPAALLNWLLRNSFLRNKIFEKEQFIDFLRLIHRGAVLRIQGCFDPNHLLSHSFANAMICASPRPLRLTILKDFDTLFSILKFRQCSQLFSEETLVMQPECLEFLVFLVRHAFFSLPKRLGLSETHIDDLTGILRNALTLKPPILPQGTARRLFQMSLEFISHCKAFFSCSPKRLMVLLLKVAIRLIQKYMTEFPHKPNEHRKKILFMGQTLSSAPFSAFLKSVNQIELKFQLLKFTR